MATKMDGIQQASLFSQGNVRMDVVVRGGNRYRVLTERLPWVALGEMANTYRAKKVDLENGRPLDLRLHIGALIAQSLNRWTDRETEEMVTLNAGVRLLCGLEQSTGSIDRTRIEAFRNQLGKEGVEALNQIVVKAALIAGFTDGRLCASDTTVQEAPIAYPTEVGHLKNIAEKLTGIGVRFKKGLAPQLANLAKKAQKLFTKLRLFARGTTEQALTQKKKLSAELQSTVAKMERLVRSSFQSMGIASQKKYQEQLELFRKILGQTRHWLKTGFHRPGKIISLWARDARAITRNKAGKACEFGRRWIVTRLTRGYIIGKACTKIGAGSDANIAEEVLDHFVQTVGHLPRTYVFDRGGDSKRTHKILEDRKIKHNGVFRKGRESLPQLGRNMKVKVRRERALTEAAIATIKNSRFGFNKPRAKSSETIVLKGYASILGANLAHFAMDCGANVH